MPKKAVILTKTNTSKNGKKEQIKNRKICKISL